MEDATPMLTIDCPLCDGEATLDDALTDVRCDACGTTTALAPDPTPATVDLAA